jgi:aminomuconate-semialdehyde/2-hydroxymuconate-6-semialdehyde dehydrogenase
MQKISNYINGQLIEPIGQSYIDNYEPATGKVYSLIPDSDERDVEMAYKAAAAAFKSWSLTSAEDKFKIMMKISSLIEQNLEALAQAESKDNGKPVSLARVMDIPRAASNFQFYAQAITQFSSEAHQMEQSFLNYTLRQPIGVVGCISPWNLPLYLFTWKIAPALAAGNCVVAKPSEVTPMTAFLLSKICIEAGLPAGVLNIVHGNGPKTGMGIVAHPHIHAISFTGGTKTGAAIAQVAAPMFKKLSLELGGKNPNIIFADCDFDDMIATTVRSSFANQGQICLCGSRIFVERSIYDKFKTAFVAKVSKMQVGNPQDENTKMGAIVSKPHFEKILSYIDLAQQEGGTVLCGGKAIQMEGEFKDGWYISPTVIEGLAYDCRTNQEEIFGPVVTITPFDKEEEVLKWLTAWHTDYQAVCGHKI